MSFRALALGLPNREVLYVTLRSKFHVGSAVARGSACLSAAAPAALFFFSSLLLSSLELSDAQVYEP